jgi:stage V sporulation protein B
MATSLDSPQDKPPSSDQAATPEPQANDTARTAGRGGLAVAAAKGYFLVIGFGQQTMLQLLLGPQGYGTYARVFAIANIANNVAIQTSILGVSRSVAEAGAGNEEIVQRRVIKYHALLAPLMAGLFFLIAPWIATKTGGSHVVTHVRVASVILFAYAMYAPMIGGLNGKRLFLKQAILDMVYATLRTVGLLGGAWLLSKQHQGPLGATIGFALAAVLIVPVALRMVGLGRSGEVGPSLKQYLGFLAPLAIAQLFLNLLMQADITGLGYLATQAALKITTVPKEASALADKSVGIYRACQLFAFLPYQGLFAITFVLFPMLAKAHGENDKEAVASYVRTGMRIAILFTCGLVAVVCALAPHMLRLVSPVAIYSVGGPVLRILTLGMGAFALFGITTTVLNSLHHERTAMWLNACAAGLVFLLVFVGVPGATLGASICMRTAAATSVALLLALVVSGFFVVRYTGALVSLKTVVRALLALGISVAVGLQLPVMGKVITLVFCAVVGLVYLLVLLLTRELGKADLALIQRVVGRKKA